jgi:hypothetical protein
MADKFASFVAEACNYDQRETLLFLLGSNAEITWEIRQSIIRYVENSRPIKPRNRPPEMETFANNILMACRVRELERKGIKSLSAIATVKDEFNRSEKTVRNAVRCGRDLLARAKRDLDDIEMQLKRANEHLKDVKRENYELKELQRKVAEVRGCEPEQVETDPKLAMLSDAMQRCVEGMRQEREFLRQGFEHLSRVLGPAETK